MGTRAILKAREGDLQNSHCKQPDLGRGLTVSAFFRRRFRKSDDCRGFIRRRGGLRRSTDDRVTAAPWLSMERRREISAFMPPPNR